uniref:Putative tRNA-His guanylyltransferase n=1 Tax=viral metagenome TaxID=1070528 RepID=A0A6M3JVN6_9ZZZZ
MEALGDRMKANYENRARYKLTRRTPVVIRLDGKAFHGITRKCERPFDDGFANAMGMTALELCQQIQGAKCAYIQSDEISILLTDFEKLTTDAWFDYNLQKMVSVSAGIASVVFTMAWENSVWEIADYAIFDSRAFNVPKEEVANYFVWRQKDWIRNSVSMLAQANYSHKQLDKKSHADMHEMLHDKGINWANLDGKWKNGQFVRKDDLGWDVSDAPIFTQNRMAIERYLEAESEDVQNNKSLHQKSAPADSGEL